MILLAVCPSIALGSELDVPEHIWNSLNSTEQIELSKKFEVKLHPVSSFGFLIDAQVLDKSTPGTNFGSNLGSAYAESRYIDRAFSGADVDYSASKQLGVGVLGAIVGSLLLDQPAVSKYYTRYTVQLANNNIQTFDETTAELGFSQTRGVCVLTNPVRAANQILCNMTKQELLTIASTGAVNNVSPSFTQETIPTRPIVSSKVKCKIGDNAPTLLDKTLCLSANGEILE